MLLDYGFDPAKIEIQPLAVERPARAKLVDKATTPIQVLFVGRIVPAKGVHDLLAAMVRLRGRRLPPLHLRVVGNMAQSDPAFRDELLRIIATNGLDEFVEFIGTVDDNECNRLLQEAHIVAMPSYHEGFCKPVIEGLRVGAIPVLYAAHNLRYIADGLCRTVPPGDVGALAESLAGAIEDAAAVAADPTRARLRLDRGHLSVGEFAEAAARHVDQFEPARIGTLLRERVSQLLAPPRE
jgi:glycosyltransferase involved in cell wall biosynthesis